MFVHCQFEQFYSSVITIRPIEGEGKSRLFTNLTVLTLTVITYSDIIFSTILSVTNELYDKEDIQ